MIIDPHNLEEACNLFDRLTCRCSRKMSPSYNSVRPQISSVIAMKYLNQIPLILRSCALLVFAILFLKAASEAIAKLQKRPVSSAISFQNGDDNDGKIKHPIVTFCHSFGYHYFVGEADLLDTHCNCHQYSPHLMLHRCAMYSKHPTDYYWKSWNQIFEFCFDKKETSFKTINESTKALSRNVGHVLNSLFYEGLIKVPSISIGGFTSFSLLEKELQKFLTPFFHDKYGICWSLDFNHFGYELVEPQVLHLKFSHFVQKAGQYATASGRKISFILAIHEIAEDRYAALETKAISLTNEKISTVQYKKINIDAISTDYIPCTENSTYEYNHCKMQKVIRTLCKRRGS